MRGKREFLVGLWQNGKMEYKNNLDHKVGIKLMDDVTLENVFPMFENLNNKIDECRKAAAERKEDKGRHYHAQYNLMYDNVFSILGARGTGKTSVAFTLREKIKQDSRHPDDVVFPIIIPEVIPDNCSILGWILAIIKEEADSLEKRFSGRRKEKGETEWGRENYWMGCDYQERTDGEMLVKRLGELRQYLFAGNYDPSNERSYYAAIDNMSAAWENNYRFANEFAELWDLWVKILNGGDKNKNPLIFFIFDDVDLAPERIEELLSVITKYLAHPNLVVIVTADEKLLLDVTEKRLDKSIGNLPKEWRTYLMGHDSVDAYGMWMDAGIREYKRDSSRDMAQMYLGKILPPSTRYYLQLFNKASQKANFWLKNDENLGDGICRQVEKLLVLTNEDQKKCFMKADGKVIDFYMNFFGNTCRQISNVYIGVQELIRNLASYIKCRTKDKSSKGEEKYILKVYTCVRYFLEIVVRCNQNLSDIIDADDDNLDISSFLDAVFLQEYHRWKLYINYTYLNDFLGIRWQNNKSGEVVEAGLQFYSLFAFVENILLILEKCTENGIAGRTQVGTVRPLVEFLRQTSFTNCYIFRDDLSADEFFLLYTALFERLPEIVERGGSDKISDAEFFYNVTPSSCNCNKEELLELYQKNSRWFLEITRMLAGMYGNVYLITKDILKVCIPFAEKLNRWGYQDYIYNFMKEEIVQCVSAFDLKEYAVNVLAKARTVNLKNTENEYNAYLFTLREEILKEQKENTDGEMEEETDQESEKMGNYMVFRSYLDYVQVRIKADNSLFEKCPAELSEDMKHFCEGGMHINDIQRLITKYVSYIEENRYSIEYMCIFELTDWYQKFQEVQKSGILSIQSEIAQIDGVLKPILRERNLSDDDIMMLSFGVEDNTYLLLENLFSRILEKLSMRMDDSETVQVREKVRALIADMDVILDLADPLMYRWASDMAMHMIFLAYLTQIYLCLCIRDGYENESYLSSKNLENTYYYTMFNDMKKLLNLRTKNASLRKLKHLIEKITLQQRRTYIEKLLEED